MKLLLDTHILIWWDSDPSQITTATMNALTDPANEVWFSVINLWEMAIKAQLGKLSMQLPLASIARQQISNGLRLLNLELDHVLKLESLTCITKIRLIACWLHKRKRYKQYW